MEQVYDIIIIGGGPAGYTAGLYAVRAGYNTLLIEKYGPGGQMGLTGIIDNYPGYENGIEGFELGMKMQQQAERFGLKTEYGMVETVQLEDEIKTVKTSTETYRAKVVIIATGANARQLNIFNEKEYTGRGVHYCAHCDGGFYKGKKVIVVGGGNSAVSDALYLSRIAKEVILIHRRDELRAANLYRKQLEEIDNIEIRYNSVVTQILAEDSVTGVKVKDIISEAESEIACQAVFISIGREPVTEYLGGVVLVDNEGYIVADETTKTNIPGVYAVGDVRTKMLRQIVTATADGAVAVAMAEEYMRA